ncbi:hypothetical protein GH714_009183 [Hevea brasiliensis]|uniref:non-specific serine/threonine protein kinase n=1 Tax=Hevea brasiliensis TaxID=3981 RepID=A0A6A6MAW1_HEVBR|nr:hypothetical protein GH714_009183 [Hevea brasiliensis]
MASQPSYRESFIRSSIETARLYGFGGLDLSWLWPNTSFDMKNIGVLLDEWRAAINSESRNTSEPRLVLTMAVHHMPIIGATSFPVESILRNIDWANIIAFDYHVPLKENVTGNHAALYDPSGYFSADSGIKEWLRRGFPASKLVLGVPYHGYAWTLLNPNDNSIGAAALGPALTKDGSAGYKLIKSFISGYGYGATSTYNATYVVNYFTIGSIWINFDDVVAIRTKISYAKTKQLLGYISFQLGNDDNWQLSQAAYEVGKDHEKKKPLALRIIVSVPLAIVILLFLLGSLSYYMRKRMLKSKGKKDSGKEQSFEVEPNTALVNEDSDQNAPNLQVFTFSEIKSATRNFSSENRLGEGGYGPVYKGKLARGQEIAVKRLSKTSHQGLKEFKNEVKLTAKLQHVNLVRLLGFCTEKGEKMLIYEYMPNKSLDFYLFVAMYPEYVKRGTYSMKYDVYSFGVLLLQIISGKKNTFLWLERKSKPFGICL